MMRRFPLLILLALMAQSAPEATAQVRLGVQGGLNMSSLSGDAPRKTSYGNHFGFAAGVIGEFQIAQDVWLSLQPMYLERGTTIGVEIEGEDEPRDSLGLRLTYVTVPLLVRVTAVHGRTYVVSGIDVGFLTDATLGAGSEQTDVKTSLKDYDVAVNFGFGVAFPIGRPRLTLEARYSQSLVNISNPDEDPENNRLPTRFRSSGFEFLAAVLLPLGSGE